MVLSSKLIGCIIRPSTTSCNYHFYLIFFLNKRLGQSCGRDRMVAGLTTTDAISAYHRCYCAFELRLLRGVLDTTLFDKVCHCMTCDRTVTFSRYSRFLHQ